MFVFSSEDKLESSSPVENTGEDEQLRFLQIGLSSPLEKMTIRLLQLEKTTHSPLEKTAVRLLHWRRQTCLLSWRRHVRHRLSSEKIIPIDDRRNVIGVRIASSGSVCDYRHERVGKGSNEQERRPIAREYSQGGARPRHASLRKSKERVEDQGGWSRFQSGSWSWS
nr:hypothetical protein Iba_chr01dCG2300 [Ipomoea batatas]